MTRTAASIGHDGGCCFHDGFPVGIRLVRDEDFTCPEHMQLRRVRHDSDRTGCDLFAHAPAGHENATALSQSIVFELVGLGACMHGFGSSLQDEQFSGPAVLCPLDVHRCCDAAYTAEVLFDRARPSRQRENLLVAESASHSIARRDRHGFHCSAAAFVVHELELLGADASLENRPESLLQRRLEDAVLIRGHRTLHDGLTEPIRRVDEHDVSEARLRIQREHDTGRRQI
jgi:hypothetical protein